MTLMDAVRRALATAAFLPVNDEAEEVVARVVREITPTPIAKIALAKRQMRP